jgi:hypothetical protein
VILYGCETWPLRLREEYGFRVVENSVQRRIFEPKCNEVTRAWRKLINEELHSLCSSPNIIRIITSRRIKLAEHVARMRGMRNA